jgi:hypothetical protein
VPELDSCEPALVTCGRLIGLVSSEDGFSLEIRCDKPAGHPETEPCIASATWLE